MRALLTVLALSGCLCAPLAQSDDCVTSQTPLIILLNHYSKEHGTQFVVDPRVRAKVTLVGMGRADLDAGKLIGILNVHGFTALTKDGVVYVVPDKVAEEAGDKFGEPWGG